MGNKPLFAMSVLAVAIVQAAYAKEDGKTISKVTKALPEITVNAFRLPVSSVCHTQTITREEIQQLRPRDVFQLLNNATGGIATQGES